jgi:3-oxoacyl-[acyl-carrier protein] reductase
MDTVLITGASRGIGKATKEIYEKNGWEVIAPTRSEMDLSDPESVIGYCDDLIKKDIKISAIVNNAGINEINEIDNVPYDEMRLMLQVDLESPIIILNKLIPLMKAQERGRIVNIGSIWAVVSKPGRAMYSAAKNGMHGITNALALELGPHGILVNTVCPGFTLTELTRKNNTDDGIASISAGIPVRRMAEPEEIGKLIYFLGSFENTYITGQKIAIDGGYSVQ